MADALIDCARSLSRAVARSFGALSGNYLGRDRPLGQSRLLFEIGESGAGVAALRARLGLDSGHLSRLLRSLEAQGLLRTRPDAADLRARIAELTPAGIAELRELNIASDDTARAIVAPLSRSQQSDLVAAMATVERLLAASAVHIEEEEPTGRAARDSLTLYYAELQSRFRQGFSPDYEQAPALDEFAPPSGTFLIMRLHGEPVGCGALKRLTGERAYIKRMWVSQAMRGLGLGRRLLDALEAKAVDLGYRFICLETHKSLEEAQQLYRSAGYVPVEPFNDEPYADHWFEKPLGSRGAREGR